MVRLLIRTLRLLLEVLSVAVITRWMIMRLRRVLLLPTQDSTPPILPSQVQPGMRRLVISDLHLGAGNRMDDFDADAELSAFIRSYALAEAPTELILAGDTFEFLQVRLPGLSDYEWSGEAAVRRLQAIMAAHPEPIAALRDFVARSSNQLTLLIGNHDFELHYLAAKQLLSQALGLEPENERLRFGISYEGGGIYMEHGNQFDPWNRFMNIEGISDPFEVVRGTQVVKDVINPIEEEELPVAALVDNVKPISAFLWYMLSLPRLRQPEVRLFVIRSLLRLFRSVALPRSYQRPVLRVREELLGAPGKTLPYELALQTVYESDPDLRQAAAAHYGGIEPEVQLRRRIAQRTMGLAQTLTRRIGHGQESEAMLAQIEQEAGKQLQREIHEFKGATLRAIARIAASPEHGHNTLFVCGHTHQAQITPLNDRQTYINLGTWTTIVLDIASGRQEEQRYPFLEVQYSGEHEILQRRLLVWSGTEQDPHPWSGGHETRINE